MERVLSQDERIRRAEEIYARRKNIMENKKSATVNVEENKKNKIYKKLIIQSLICVVIYACFYKLKETPNIIPEDVMYKISDILEYDINITEIYKKIDNYLNKTINEENTNQTLLVEDTLAATDSNIEQENQQEVESNSEPVIEQNVEDNNGQNIEENIENLSQMEIDAKYIKENYSLIKPLEGEITSRFGLRNPTVPTVPKNHTGIDIARVIGTVIVASMEGDVELVSSQGDLRKSHKNNKWRCFNSICTLQ